MVVFPNCKINIGLNVIRKRSDGFHDLETIFYPVPFTDALEVITLDTGRETSTAGITFSMSGLQVDGDADNNLCVKAYHLLKAGYPQIPAVKSHLHKAIPMGAGLGGGSADGAFMLQLLNRKYELALTQNQLTAYALQLGSDCPFFMVNKPCFAEGRGEIMQPVHLDLTGYSLLLVNPGVHVNTGWAFRQLTPAVPPVSLLETIAMPVESWKENITNDFEVAVTNTFPVLNHIKEKMYNNGASYVAMSGSGSTMFGLFKNDHAPAGLLFGGDFFERLFKL